MLDKNNNKKSLFDKTQISRQNSGDFDAPEKTEVSKSSMVESVLDKAAKIAAKDPLNKSLAPDNQQTSIESRLSTQHQKALTQIETSFSSHSTSHGFETAKKDADQALANNKIILNERFVLIETLGSGGMGTVYKAQDLRKVEASDNNPFIAVKILNSDFRNHPDAFISLQREASRSHLLSHPNIVTVHDFDRDGETIFMTMGLLDGEDLEALLNRHKNKGVGKETALQILRDYCVALNFAHKKGIIHSDLKPGNIFVTKEEGTKVLDFGIARLALESSTKDHFDAGRIGAITPAYASLEMIGHQPPDQRDDIFAAAIIAYELFTGRHPFDSKSAATALAQNLKPKKISGLSSRQWKTLSKALELRRNDRTKTILEFMLGMTVVPKFPIYRLSSILLVGVVSWFVYDEFYGPNELNKVIEETLTKANQCYSDKNFRCTIESATAILEMSPNHEQALKLQYQARVKQLETNIDACLKSENAVSCAFEPIQSLMEIEPQNVLISIANEKIASQKLQAEISKLIAAAENCFENKNYQCAIENASLVVELRSDHLRANSLILQSENAIEQDKTARLLQKQGFESNFNKAKNCFAKNDYSCTKKYALIALEFDSNQHQAEELIQNADYAQKQQRENFNKANKIIKDGRACLKKLNYSCAIAKSESALEFVPGYKKAIQLKSDATKLLNNVKKNIEIE